MNSKSEAEHLGAGVRFLRPCLPGGVLAETEMSRWRL